MRLRPQIVEPQPIAEELDGHESAPKKRTLVNIGSAARYLATAQPFERSRTNNRRHTMPKQTKYAYLFVVQGNYGQGWEDVTAEELWSEARARRKEYDANEPYPHRVIKRRELRSASHA